MKRKVTRTNQFRLMSCYYYYYVNAIEKNKNNNWKKKTNIQCFIHLHESSNETGVIETFERWPDYNIAQEIASRTMEWSKEPTATQPRNFNLLREKKNPAARKNAQWKIFWNFTFPGGSIGYFVHKHLLI